VGFISKAEVLELTFLCSPNPKGLVVLLLFVMLISGAAIGWTNSDSASSSSSEISRLDAAMLHVLTNGLEKHRIRPNLRHVLVTRHIERRAFARALVDAGNAHRISPWLLLAVSFRESAWMNRHPGALGDLSAFQVMPSTARAMGCSLSTDADAALCAASLLRHWLDKCGTLTGALTRYATGKSCTPRSPRVLWLTRDRLGIAKKLEKMFP